MKAKQRRNNRMKTEAIIFLIIGGVFLWGGLAQALIREFKKGDMK